MSSQVGEVGCGDPSTLTSTLSGYWDLQAVFCVVSSTSYLYIYILNEFVSISHIPAALATRGRSERLGSANFAGPVRKT